MIAPPPSNQCHYAQNSIIEDVSMPMNKKLKTSTSNIKLQHPLQGSNSKVRFKYSDVD